MRDPKTRDELAHDEYYASRHENKVLEPMTFLVLEDAVVIADEIFKVSELTEEDVVALADQEDPEWLVQSLKEILEHRKKMGVI